MGRGQSMHHSSAWGRHARYHRYSWRWRNESRGRNVSCWCMRRGTFFSHLNLLLGGFTVAEFDEDLFWANVVEL